MPRGRARGGRGGRGGGGATAGDGQGIAGPTQVTDGIQAVNAEAAQGKGTGAAEPLQNACASVGEAPKDASSSVCGMCERAVGDSAIGCDRCSDWFCPSETCTGLPENAIALISSLREENSVLFVCTGCRVNPGPGTWTEAPARKQRGGENECVKQLYMTVKGLTVEMANLSAKLDSAISHRSLGYAAVASQSGSHPQQQHGGSDERGHRCTEESTEHKHSFRV